MKKTVVITGGTKGLGRETALAFGRAGYFVVALYAADESAAKEFETALLEASIPGCALRHDACSENTDVWNHPEIQNAESLTLIHNACAPFTPAPMHQLKWQDFESSFNVAIKGGWLCSQALIRLMLKKKQGVIVTVLTSAVEGFPPKGFGAYITAKHALRGLTLGLAAEYADRGIRVFSVSPGFMQTALTEGWDARLRDAIVSGPSRASHPPQAGRRIFELVENRNIAGRGENHQV